RTGMQMLGENTGGVLHRHFIAGESNQSRTACDMKLIERRAEQWRLLLRFAHACLPRMADRARRKRMREESRRTGAPHGRDCAAVPVPPLCVWLRTLSRRRAQRAPLSRDVNHRGPFA